MQKMTFGRTGLDVSRLTMGCGAVGGLMTRGRARDQDYAVHWARDNGINFFDTAASYGDGASEENLGRALQGNKNGIVVSTKVAIAESDLDDVSGAVARSINNSLRRLNLDHVDILQLHNTVGEPDRHGSIDQELLFSEVVEAFEKVREAGKSRFFGFTAKGDPDALTRWITSGQFDSAQIFYNLLVPSAGWVQPANFPAVNYQCLIDTAAKNGVGSIGVRVLAGGALSGSEIRHPLGMPVVKPIGSSTDYAEDVKLAHEFMPLIEAGVASTLSELAIRYVISNDALPTTEIGIATVEELQTAADAANKGRLPPSAIDWIQKIQSARASKTEKHQELNA